MHQLNRIQLYESELKVDTVYFDCRDETVLLIMTLNFARVCYVRC